ncbi:Receptor-type guanylate cyclase gcy [Seminavis robusta]|uniref:Receptor-type guanylate cyclase gcy n=1 Tax=Seminavis robusta TaxID=568900 RepID=A0A9N8HT90_9STRA|nr:Receptor-type guanylate cyclase gcy [Seminavis robusta]|eukprot:Sro1630_g287160.1 Receptor-type guanylate cyclase gcy (1182) ;mRNA; f:1051-5570
MGINENSLPLLDDDELSVSSKLSSDNGSSTFDPTDSDERNADFNEVKNLTRKENEAVEMWRELVTGMLVITACLVTCGSFIYLSIDETSSFKTSFNQDVVTIDDAAGDALERTISGFKSMGDKLTTHAQSSGSAWPLVTMPFFDIHGDDTRVITHVTYFSVCPIVMEPEKSAWEEYALNNQWWLVGNQTHAHTEQEMQNLSAAVAAENSIPEYIYRVEDRKPTATNVGPGPYTPRWQMSPTPNDPVPVNFDVVSSKGSMEFFEFMIANEKPVLSGVITEDFTNTAMLHREADIIDMAPKSFMFYPIFESFDQDAAVVGMFEIYLDWQLFLADLLPEGDTGLFYVLNCSCSGMFTYELNGGKVHYVGKGNLHDIFYTHLGQEVQVTTRWDSHNVTTPCSFSLLVYPSSEMRGSFSSSMPEVFTVIIAVVFFVMAFVFFSYDKYVQKRQEKVFRQAVKTNRIVSSFFPRSIRDRLFNQDGGEGGENSSRRRRSSTWAGSLRLKSYLNDGDDGTSVAAEDDKPIADLFPNCTVLFADIVGFTAWSSMREPTQVLLLLETIYRAFDEIAKRRKVFKVETIGDCYVAVTGLPEPHKLHALVMAKFAREIMYKLHEVTRSLEVSLGPDTGDLSMRVGLHSGPVTAGVLRADRLRFQLFGDTVNTASRIESTGVRGCIQLSKETAELICNSGRAHWVREREDKVEAKGKGQLTTFWLSLGAASSIGDSGENFAEETGQGLSYYDIPRNQKESDLPRKTRRLVEWNVDILHRVLRQIAATRKVKDRQVKRTKTLDKNATEKAKPTMVLEELAEVIQLPRFSSKVAQVVANAEEEPVPPVVVNQLHNFVAELAAMYHDNPFHNFEHASHVTMSVVKLLSRIVAPTDLDVVDDENVNEKAFMKSVASKLHDNTYGITSDPLTQFAVVLSALIHDVDHLGVPNTQLVTEETATAIRYKGKSVAEQNSVDESWNLLMMPDYSELRKAIAATQTDWERFRQLVVNSVLATDIADKEQKQFRNARWDKAFKDDFYEEDMDVDRNRKATIVIEHLIQASDVSHTMQHWHIYRKWNERLFRELYKAYKEGRAVSDPTDFWYKGEIGFFDFYIIPLTKKLKECGVFGVSSDEYLNYAQQNLAEWKAKGEQVVAEMSTKVREEYGEVDCSEFVDEAIDEPEPGPEANVEQGVDDLDVSA